MRFRTGKKRKNTTSSFSGLLPELLDDLGIREEYIIEMIRAAWPELTSTIMATHSIPDRIQDSVLWVAVDHPAYANELVLMKDHVIRGIRDRLNLSLVSSLRIETRALKWVN